MREHRESGPDASYPKREGPDKQCHLGSKIGSGSEDGEYPLARDQNVPFLSGYQFLISLTINMSAKRSMMTAVHSRGPSILGRNV